MRILIAEDEIATAKASDKRLDTDIAEEVFITGDKAAIQQMLSVLLDNAVRYSDDNGEIRFSVFKKRGRSA